jgi:hypothetical protein
MNIKIYYIIQHIEYISEYKISIAAYFDSDTIKDPYYFILNIFLKENNQFFYFLNQNHQLFINEIYLFFLNGKYDRITPMLTFFQTYLLFY